MRPARLPNDFPLTWCLFSLSSYFILLGPASGSDGPEPMDSKGGKYDMLSVAGSREGERMASIVPQWIGGDMGVVGVSRILYEKECEPMDRALGVCEMTREETAGEDMVVVAMRGDWMNDRMC